MNASEPLVTTEELYGLLGWALPGTATDSAPTQPPVTPLPTFTSVSA